MQIAGEFRDARDAKDVELISNPFDGAPIAEVVRASASDMDAAIGHAHAAFESGERPATHRRAELLETIALRVRERASEIATLIAKESGKPIRYARGEVARAALTFTLGAGESRRLGGELMPIDQLPGAEGRMCVYERVPRGPIAAIAPFNFPLNLVAHKLSPALAVGAPTVLKPALQSPLTAHLLGRMLLECGMPAAELSVLHAQADVAERLVTDPRMAVLSFTGSDAVGWRLKSLAGKKQVLLELGGNAPCIVDDGADLDAIVPRLVEGCFANAGQICIRVQRVLVARRLFADFTERFVAATRAVKCGDPLAEDTIVGPLIEPRHVTRVLEWIREAQGGGARLLCGGEAERQIVRPALLTDVPRASRLARDEVFGPVTVLEPFESFDEALALCNQSRFGLQAGVFTPDVGRALKAFRTLRYGAVLINDTPMLRIDNYPYGGSKDSGIGREGVRFAVEEFSETKTLVMRG